MKLGKQAIRFQLTVPFSKKVDNGWHIASCDVLDVHSQGRTDREAVENLREALQLFITSCYERGTLQQVLMDCGFEPNDGDDYEDAVQTLDVPLPLIARHAEARTY